MASFRKAPFAFLAKSVSKVAVFPSAHRFHSMPKKIVALFSTLYTFFS